jgi:hypothetical protein
MLRTCVALGVGLVLTAGSVLNAQQAQPPAQVQVQPTKVPTVNYMRGKITRIDPTTNSIWIRSGFGAEAKTQQYRLNDTVKYYGADNKALEDGLRNKAFRNGANVWYRMAPGQTSMSELWLGPPPAGATNPGKGAPGGAGGAGGGR